eukprot:scaffold1254_cov251-Pinguiococcus_pyrenoidosus.AAC.13
MPSTLRACAFISRTRVAVRCELWRTSPKSCSLCRGQGSSSPVFVDYCHRSHTISCLGGLPTIQMMVFHALKEQRLGAFQSRGGAFGLCSSPSPRIMGATPSKLSIHVPAQAVASGDYGNQRCDQDDADEGEQGAEPEILSYETGEHGEEYSRERSSSSKPA